jgi:hypothetical protein
MSGLDTTVSTSGVVPSHVRQATLAFTLNATPNLLLTLFTVGQIWNHSNNTLGRGSLACISHNQQLHYVIIHISVKNKQQKYSL